MGGNDVLNTVIRIRSSGQGRLNLYNFQRLTRDALRNFHARYEAKCFILQRLPIISTTAKIEIAPKHPFHSIQSYDSTIRVIKSTAMSSNAEPLAVHASIFKTSPQSNLDRLLPQHPRLRHPHYLPSAPFLGSQSYPLDRTRLRFHRRLSTLNLQHCR